MVSVDLTLMLFVSRGKKSKPRALVLGLDGTPHSLIKKFLTEKRMPNLAALMEEGSVVSMRFV